MNNIRKIFPIIILIITFFQLLIYFNNLTFKEDKIIIDKEIIKQKRTATIKEIDNNLNNIENLKINNQILLDEGWKCNISLYGNKDEVINAMRLLEEFKVIKYSIYGNEAVLDVNMDILR